MFTTTKRQHRGLNGKTWRVREIREIRRSFWDEEETKAISNAFREFRTVPTNSRKKAIFLNDPQLADICHREGSRRCFHKVKIAQAQVLGCVQIAKKNIFKTKKTKQTNKRERGGTRTTTSRRTKDESLAKTSGGWSPHETPVRNATIAVNCQG